MYHRGDIVTFRGNSDWYYITDIAPDGVCIAREAHFVKHVVNYPENYHGIFNVNKKELVSDASLIDDTFEFDFRVSFV